MTNALLQLIASIFPKVANRKQQSVTTEKMEYDPKPISFYEIYAKLPDSFDLALNDLLEPETLPASYIIVLLEYFSNFEHRLFWDVLRDVEKLAGAFENLMKNSNHKVRYLASRCFAQSLEMSQQLAPQINKQIATVFDEDENLAHSSIVAVTFMLKRYVTCNKFLNDNSKFYFEQIRDIFQNSHKKILQGSSSFYYRSCLLDLLIYVGFQFTDDLVQSLMFGMKIKNQFGYNVWKQKINKFLMVETEESEMVVDLGN